LEVVQEICHLGNELNILSDLTSQLASRLMPVLKEAAPCTEAKEELIPKMRHGILFNC